MFGETDKKKQAEDKKKIDEQIRATIEIGQQCLSNPIFAKYREKLDKIKKNALKLLVTYAEPDPVKDAFYTRVLLNKIDVLSMLLEEVEKDSKRRF